MPPYMCSWSDGLQPNKPLESQNRLCVYLCWKAFTLLCLLLTSLLLQKQAADEREAGMRRSLRDADAKHKNQITHLDASVLELQRYAQ